jgi:hypothetical protein
MINQKSKNIKSDQIARPGVGWNGVKLINENILK